MSAILPRSLAVVSPSQAEAILSAPRRAAEQTALLAERSRAEAIMECHRAADAERYRREVVAPILTLPAVERAAAVDAYVSRVAPSGWDSPLEIVGAVTAGIRGRLLTALDEAGAPVAV